MVSSKKLSLTDSELVTSDPDFVLANPDAELSDAAIQAVASLLLSALENESVNHDGGEDHE